MKKEKYIDFIALPKKNKKINNKDRLVIDWKNSIGCSLNFLYDNLSGDLKIIDYIPKSQMLTIIYKENKYKISTSNLLKCSLGKILNKYTKDFKIEIGANLKDSKRDIIITDKKYLENKSGKKYKFYKYRCNRCGFDCGKHYDIQKKTYKEELWAGESGLLNGSGCSCCNYSPNIVVNGINDILTTDFWMTFIIDNEEICRTHTRKSNLKIYPKCPDCEKVKNKKMAISDIYERRSIGCSCGDGCSKISKYIYNILEQLKRNNQIFDFDTEKQFEWCCFYNPFIEKMTFGRYDFFIPDKNILIEADGGFHRQDNTLNGQKLETSVFIDNQKDKLAIENDYLIIRISDDGNFKENILNSKLKDIFNLEMIDWGEALEYSSNNLVKTACQYKKANPELTAKDIADIMKYNRTSIIKWLKTGTELGWCCYNPKKEIKIAHLKNADRNIKRCSKKVEVFKDGKSVGVFSSCSELERCSEKIFGVKLYNGAISSVASKKKKEYKGFKFNYVEKEELHGHYV